MSAMYVVQSYQPGKRGAVVADTPVEARDLVHAKQLAERLAGRKPLVIAFVREGDAITGDFEDPKLIVAYGELPEELNEMQRM
ncbi:hypothetical protein [Hoeflea sp. 108]|jgi:hypothetical protein|uniref:hypothetical protein n=1 Tax=Hoeflea sp. 108 TaxID=1116369 RepID=UPI0012F93BD1|nr:hypothetical protein [Hoeflea sp. 108]